MQHDWPASAAAAAVPSVLSGKYARCQLSSNIMTNFAGMTLCYICHITVFVTFRGQICSSLFALVDTDVATVSRSHSMTHA